jgi:DNA invertase Pin-like site-specific DNA recombinase
MKKTNLKAVQKNSNEEVEMKAIIYPSVSTAEQMENGGFSISAQICEIKQYCERHGFTIQNEYLVGTRSIKKHKKILQELMNTEGRIALIVMGIDSLSTNFLETHTLERLRKEDKIEIHFIRENLIVNANSSGSELFRWSFASLMARHYSNA